MKRNVFLVLLLLALIAIVPMVNADEKNITISITSPEEGDIIFYDVIPAHIVVQGTIDAPRGIQNVSISNGLIESGYGEVICGSNYGTHFDLSCEIFMTDHITVTVTDTSGFVTSVSRNFISYARPPGPGDFWAHGWIVDPNGQPIPNASIIFERMGGNTPFEAITMSRADGAYKMKKTSGINQKITVQKEGYQTLVREVAFRNYNNELNLTLTPQGTSIPGFNFTSAISAILVSLFLITITRRRR
jgi:hypothetical protein